MMKHNKVSLADLFKVSAFVIALVASDAALAADAGKVATNVANSFNAMGLAAQAFFALAGIVMIGLAGFTFIKWNKTDGQGAKLSLGFLYLVVGCCLFYIASLIQTTGDTAWGEGQGNRTRVQITQ